MIASALDRTVEILLVEDNPGDVRLAREALKEHALPFHLSVANDGDAALDFLQHARQQNASSLRPDLILLDLNLPGLSGLEVLAAIKSDPKLSMIPVVVLSMSRAEHDIRAAYANHANCYINKPIDLDEFIEVVGQLERFWFQLACLPPGAMNDD